MLFGGTDGEDDAGGGLEVGFDFGPGTKVELH